MKLPWLMLIAVPFCADAHGPQVHGAPLQASPDAAGDYVVRLEEMIAIEAGKGERIRLLQGREHGFRNLSFILTETAPGGGPPLHSHESEEAHILTAGTMSYVIGDQTFTVTAPYVLRVPAHTPHTFINSGTAPLSLIAVFDSADYTFNPLAANPLQPSEQAAE